MDILGFKKIIDDTMKKEKGGTENEDSTKTDFLIETINEMTEIANKTHKETSKTVTQFSDSIVISFIENDLKEIPKLFFNLQRLIANLLSREILCRGAISYGKLYHKNNLIFGPALNDAYETESKAALYPRVILDSSVLEVMKYYYTLENKHQYRKIIFASDVDSYLKTDTDDKFFIDYFTGTMMFFKGDDLFRIYKNLRKMIINGLRYKNPNINIKYGWMKNKYNKLPDMLQRLDEEEELFCKRPDIEKYYKEFKPIKTTANT